MNSEVLTRVALELGLLADMIAMVVAWAFGSTNGIIFFGFCMVGFILLDIRFDLREQNKTKD